MDTLTTPGRLETALRTAGRKLLVPYVTGGLTDNWTDFIAAYEQAGADAVEIGLPFSDPMIDGSVIQQASDVALARGTTVASILADVAKLRPGIPLVAMTYYNLVQRRGLAVFCAALAEAGISGLIVPDAPLEEAGDLAAAAGQHGVELVRLAAPSTPPARLTEIAERSRGFIYAISLMGTTGVRAELAATAGQLAADLKARTDMPVILGLGISTPEHAAEASRYADGVVIASRIMREVLDGATPAEVGAWLATVRTALDA
nr:tryptophan synthase subunit alpha [Longispora albida]